MSGPLGLSIGTTNLVAVRVGNQPVSRRSVLTLSTDRTPQVGLHESGHGVTLSGFVERVGDPVPLVAPDGASYPADTLLVEALDAMVELAGGPSEQLAIAVPAHWTAPTMRALRNALRTNPSLSRGGLPARLVPDSVASLTALRANPGLPTQGVVALLDFGGGGTSITLADAAAAFEPLDETTRHPDFSGDQIDQALLTHILDGAAQSGGLDPAGTAAVGSLARLREECRQAKERLSADTATDLAVELPGYSATVRVTRPELEALMHAPLAGVLEALETALERNGIGWPAISAVVTIGGGANIPLVTQQLSEHSQAAVVTTPQPALDAAIGAALAAAYVAEADAQTGMAPTLGVAAAVPTAGIPSAPAGPAGEGSSTFRALAWSEDESDDDVVPYTGPDLVDSYGSETAARPAVQYVPPTGPIEQPASGWQRLPFAVFAVAAALVVVAIGGVTYALTSATGTVPSSPVKTAEPKPLPQEPAPSAIAPPPVEPPPAPEPVIETPPPPPVTVTQAPPPPVTETHVVTQTTTPPPTTTTTTTTTTPPTTTTTTTPPTTTTTVPTTTTTTTNPMTTTYVTVPFVPVPIPIQVPNRGETQNPYPQQPQYPYQQQPQNPFQPYP
ncbi:Hsp70 family protein [Mycobacterium sp. TNTM28]|uniref:Hsp70 family protein n=1 Tax=[Mycobacterium] fortunisiensis TaxID=2600579 RepID=A0ABS6KGI1_9MYCO|nr:Hsp70 family protein [[Mycobacterium] fortunisiensis]MBU9762670.1 Hsp70 family protein [[Mycobacterium] fortunisiensis]